MSNYWQKKKEELEKEEAKKKKSTGSDYWKDKMDELEAEEAAINTKAAAGTASAIVSSASVANLGVYLDKVKNPWKYQEEEKDDGRTWFQTPKNWEDGWDLFDVTKTILGTIGDAGEEMLAGVMEMGESTVDSGAFVIGNAANKLGFTGFADDMKEFVADDLYDSDEVIKSAQESVWGRGVIQQLLVNMGESPDVDQTSVLGEKSDDLAESGGRLAGQIGLSAMGVPWWVSTVATTAGDSAEGAFNEGATYEEAAFAVVVDTGAELLTEKMFGGSGLGEKGLFNTSKLTSAISNKAVKAAADFGVDMVGEGTEEFTAEFFSKLGAQLSYEKEETWEELLNDEAKMDAYLDQFVENMFGEQAIEDYLEAGIGGMALGGGANTGKVGSSIKNGTDYHTGLTANEQKVFDETYNKLLADAEADGKKLTKNEKDAIRDSLVKSFNNEYKNRVTEAEEEKGKGLTTAEKKALHDDVATHFTENDIFNWKDMSAYSPAAGGTPLMTHSETQVFDKEYDKRIAEAEKEKGKSLTTREKADIRDTLVEGFKRGNISMDSIGETLGGDGYKAYKDAVANEKALLQEYNELGDLVDSQMTAKQKKRFAELEQLLAESKNPETRKRLWENMNSEMSDMAQRNPLLAESYTQDIKRRSDFQADVTKYDAKQQAIIQKAIDSKILNDTRETHEFVDWIAGVSAKTGVSFDFTNNEKLKESGFALDGKVINGYVTKDGVTLNLNSKKALNSVVGHEITHVLEGTDMYDALKNTLFEYAKNKGEYQSRYDSLAELYKNVKDANVEKELTADLVGDYLFTDGEFVKKLSKDRNLFQKIYDEIKYLAKMATAGSKEARELEKAKKLFENAYREGGKAQNNTADGGTQYSLAGKTTPSYEELVAKNPAKIVDVKAGIASGSYADMKTAAMSKATSEGWFDKPHHNNDTDSLIFLTEKSFSHAYSNLKAEFGEDTIRSMAHIPEIIENAVLVSVDDPRNPNRQETKVYTFFGAIDGVGGTEPVKLTVKEYDFSTLDAVPQNIRSYFEENGVMDSYDSLYDAHALEVIGIEGIKKEPDASGRVNEQGSQAQATSDSEISIADLLNLVKGDATKYIPKKQYSLSDSNGKQLSKEQQEYFKDSKIRDADGNLKVMHHGSSENFTVFDRKKAKSSGYYGNGFYFTDSESHAKQYGNTYDVYLNITNPLQDGTNDITKDQLRKFVEAIAENEDYGIENYGYGATVDSVTDSVYGKSDFAMLMDINASCVGNMVEAIELFNKVNGTGYNGIVAPTETVAFYPEQIKRVDNKAPTPDPDIRYSLSPETDTAYMDAANRGDTESAKKMVDQFAIEQGFSVDADGKPDLLFHGTDSFGFTKIDTSASDDGITFWATPNIGVAGSYYEGSNYKVREIGKEKVAPKGEKIPYYSSMEKAVNAAKPFSAELGQDLSKAKYVNEAKVMKKAGKSIQKAVAAAETVRNGNFPAPIKKIAEKIIQASEVGTYDAWNKTITQQKWQEFEEITGVKFWEIDLPIKFNPNNPADISKVTQADPDVFRMMYHIGDVLDEINMDERGALKGQEIYKSDIINSYNDYVAEKGIYGFYHKQSNPFVYDCGGVDWNKIAVPAEAKGYFSGDVVNTRQLAEWAFDNGYDAIRLDNVVDVGGYALQEAEAPSTVWAFKNPESQLKSADPITYDDKGKAIPLSERFNAGNNDIRYSLSEEGQQPKQYGDYNVYGKDIARQTEQDIAPVEQTTQGEMFPDDLAPIEADDADRINSLDDADAPPEAAPYYGEPEKAAKPDDPFKSRDWYDIGNRKVKAYMYENPEVKPFFQEEALNLLGELNNTIKAERWYNDELYYESGGEKGFGGNKRLTSASMEELLDSWHMTYADIEKGLNAIIEDHGAENIAAAKKLEFMLNDRLLHGYKDFYSNGRIPPNQDYINLLNEKQINNYSKEAFDSLMQEADQYAPMGDVAPVPKNTAPVAENIAPAPEAKTTKGGEVKGQQAMYKEAIRGESDKVAKILFEQQQTPKQKSAWKWSREHIFSHGAVFEDLSLKTGNRELQARFDNIRRAENMAQTFMGKGKGNAKALVDVRKAVEKSGKIEDFNYYLYHLHNVDRMTLEQRFKDVPNKSVFGDSVDAEASRKAAMNLETMNPEFKGWAEDLYAINSHLRQMMVDEGIISQETADLWQTMYPHYVPINRAGQTGLNVNVPLDTKRTGVNAPIKKAEGGNSDFYNVFDTMGSRIEQTYKAIAKNRFGVELMNTIGTEIDSETTDVDSVLETMDAHEELLQEGKNGESPTFTVFRDGERVKFAITEGMYDAMKPGKFTYTNKALNKINNIRRDILTTYSPTFALTNPIKDVQDIIMNSQHPAKTYATIPEAIYSVMSKNHWYQERMERGGAQDTYFDTQTKTFKKEDGAFKKVVGFLPSKIRAVNEVIEQVPRMAEYIASRKMGRSIDVSMLDAARVTTNFGAAGDFTNMLNRNGFTFLGASVEGFNQQVRNVREAKAKGAKGWAKLATKCVVAGLPAMLLNHLLWDDDEEYAELSDYVKQNYYVVGKTEDGKFIRVPKGRTVSVIQEAFQQMENLITGNDEVDFDAFAQLVINNLAPNNPLENNIIAPIYQAATNKTWYGDDLVPTRLQDLPAAEQYDETTDSFSKWLGEATDTSPYKWNYLLDQYSGGIGDMTLPYLTPEADGGGMGAAFRDKFVTDPVLKNQNVTDFYDLKDELTTKANSMYATDEDKLKSMYMNAINSELSELYKQKREIQNSNLSDTEKYSKVREIQQQIVDLTKEGMGGYQDISYEDDYREGGQYARVSDKVYKLSDDGAWQKLSDEQLTKYEVTKAAGDASYATDGTNHYRWYVPGEDASEDAKPGWKKVTKDELERQNEVTSGLGISPEQYWNKKEEYSFAYDNPERYAVSKAVGGYDSYKTYSSELYDIKADKDENGKSISGSRKEKVIDYINNLDADYGEKIILFKSEYPADDSHNMDIIDYLNSRDDISYKEMETILKELGFNVTSDGRVTW